MVAHYREAAGWEASVAHGTFGIHARLFGRRRGDCGRIADVIRCVHLFSRPNDPATNHGGFGKAERTQANTNANIQNRPLGTPRRPSRCAGRGCRGGCGRGWCENEGRCRCPPKGTFGECSFARAISAAAGSASPPEELAIPASAGADLCASRPRLCPGVSVRVWRNLVMLQGFHRRQWAARESKTLAKIWRTTRRTEQDKPRHPRRAALARVRRVGPSR
jgi:hypothetical protein